MRLFFLLLAPAILAAADTPSYQLLQHPTMNKTHIVFAYAADLWEVPRDGGEAIRLTTGVGVETDPFFSPDGKYVAFTGEYDGNYDVYVVAAEGGVPKRLTSHPTQDRVVGWTPDSKRVLFRSGRTSYSRFDKLFTVGLEGGLPQQLPLPMGIAGSYSADATQIAYVPFGPTRPFHSLDAWKRYRGGRAMPVWIAKLSDSSIVKVPRETSNDSDPMWIASKIYFLSDRNGPTTLFAYDIAKKSVSQVLPNSGMDVKSASSGPGGIVYDQFGTLHIYDTASGKTKTVSVTLTGDLPEVRPRFTNVAPEIRDAKLSPTGVRALFEAHGEILTIPAEKGDVRNLSNSPGVMDRTPAWSPDGKHIAWFSDESGEYMLHVAEQNGAGKVRKIALEANPAFYYDPRWSPDSKKIAYTDNRLNVWYLDVESEKATKIDTDTYYDPVSYLDPAWSPDSRWIAYTRQLKNHLRALFVYSLETGKAEQVTDGLSDARYAQFDKEGKYLYFTASTNSGPTSGWLDMSGDPHHVTRSVYLVVLSKTGTSPLAPESDEEKPAEEPKKDAEKKPAEKVNVAIDFDGIQQRILALPMPARGYTALQTGKTGVLFVSEEELGVATPGTATLQRFTMKTKKTEKVMEGISLFDVSFDGGKVLTKKSTQFTVFNAAEMPKAGEGVLKTESLEVRVDPRAEWKQMYREVWRIERDFFYDPSYHGLDLKAAQTMYEPYVENVAARADLNYVFQDMLGELTVGHLYIRGGAVPKAKEVKGGLLGADYEIANGRYRFARVFNGENWNPNLKAPLTEPGVNVKAGEYLLAVGGRDVTANDEVYSFFEGTAGKPVLIKVGPDPSGANAREVTVVPVESETTLRNLAWIEDNRRKVDQVTGGRVAYVYMPDTGSGGFTSFNRYFFAQVEKDAVIVDERFNGGGQAADYVIDVLRRPFLSYWSTRYGADTRTPVGAIFGPKAMIVNEFAGSGGDAMPWYFRKTGLGPVIGKRTWGGLVGILGFPVLMDGGTITAPNLAFWSTKGEWDVENHGVAPDIEVELDPKAVREGHDPQLEKAIAVVMDELKKNPVPVHKRPAYPNYHQPAGTSSGGTQ